MLDDELDVDEPLEICTLAWLLVVDGETTADDVEELLVVVLATTGRVMGGLASSSLN